MARDNNVLDTKAGKVASVIAVGVVFGSAMLALSNGKADAKAAVLLLDEVDQTTPVVAELTHAWSQSATANDKAAVISKARGLYTHNQIQTRADYGAVADILSGSSDLENLRLGHDLAIVALARGYQRAANTVTTSEDRMMEQLGQAPSWKKRGDQEPIINEKARAYVFHSPTMVGAPQAIVCRPSKAL